MMKNLALIILVIVGLIINSSCNKESDTTPDIPQQIIDNSTSMFEGSVIEKELDNEEGIEAWEIKIQNTNSSTVKFYWAVSNQALVKIEGDQGPFDYELNPGMNLINFSTAKTFAISALKNDAITKWELEQNDNFLDQWVYIFEMDDDGETVKVYVDATNGDILQID